MSLLATRDDLLDDVFLNWVPTGPARYGIYVLRFCKGHSWYHLVIDDKLPRTKRSLSLVFARCRDRMELWVPFIEKAYAKLHNNYKSIVGGCVCPCMDSGAVSALQLSAYMPGCVGLGGWATSYVDEGLRDLTGYPTQMLRLPHSLMGDAEKRLFAAQYAGTTDAISQAPWTAKDEEGARTALTVRLRCVLLFGGTCLLLLSHVSHLNPGRRFPCIRRWAKQGCMLGCSHTCTGQKHEWKAQKEGDKEVMRLSCVRDAAAKKSKKVEQEIAKGIRQKHA